MKKLIYAIPLILSIFCFSCRDNSPIQKVVSDYRSGTISDDSLLAYVSDSVRVKETFDWASRHHYKDEIAAWFLGRAYKFGLGVDRDPLKAKAYYISACEKGNGNAMNGLAQIYMAYPGQENLDSAFYWFNKAASHGNPDAYFYLSGIEMVRDVQNGLPIDTAKFIEYLQKGVSLNSPKCCLTMAALYYSGEDNIKADKVKAFNLIRIVPKDKLDNEGNYLLGNMYELGEGTNQSFNIALSYYKKSAKQGNTDAMCKLGNFYQFGKGVEQNDSLAFLQYNKAANAGNSWGQRCVAICYKNGIGTKKDIGVAYSWYKTAAKGGDSEAIKYCETNKIDY
ncbi:MAG: sel1 repeat family protein [Bacteroidales bacterium]|nr:sel1 repeat family protein [Bacteroidales bacterium]